MICALPPFRTEERSVVAGPGRAPLELLVGPRAAGPLVRLDDGRPSRVALYDADAVVAFT